jgi:protein ERP2
MFYNLNFFVFFLTVLVIPLYAFDIELTIIIPANQRECFHQVIEMGQTVEIQYEVLAGGDIDINYWFYSPTNRVLQSDLKKGDGHQTLKLEETGEYRFCFDNSFSRFSQKQVYFSLRPINEHGQNGNDRMTESWMNLMDKDELGDLQSKVADIKVRKKEAELINTKLIYDLRLRNFYDKRQVIKSTSVTLLINILREK